MGRRRSLSQVVPEGGIATKKGRKGPPFFYPAEKPLELLFFRRCFSRLCDSYGMSNQETKAVPVAFFQRAITRLYKMVDHEGEEFDVKTYDADGNGYIEWQEFCQCWRDVKFKISLGPVERVHVTLDSIGTTNSILAKIIANFIMFVIFLSSMSFILSTLLILRQSPEDDPDGAPSTHEAFAHLEVACVMIFSIEYLCRVCTAHATRLELLDHDILLNMLIEDAPVRKLTPQQRLWMFLIEPSNVIDIMAILPWYLEKAKLVDANLTFLRMVRLTRILRVLRIDAIQDAVDTLAKTLVMSASSLYVLCFYIVLGVIIMSSLIYFSEVGVWEPNTDGDYLETVRGVYHRKTWDGELDRSPFTSIPKAIWFVIVTVTTVGYGDINLITNTGRLVGTMTIVGGAVAFAMPIGVISSNFARVWEDKEKEKTQTIEFINRENKTVATEILLGNRLAEMVVLIFDDQGMGTPPLLLGQAVIPLNLLEANLCQERAGGTMLTLDLQPPTVVNGTALGMGDDMDCPGVEAQGNVNVSLIWVPDKETITEKNKEELLSLKQDLRDRKSVV